MCKLQKQRSYDKYIFAESALEYSDAVINVWQKEIHVCFFLLQKANALPFFLVPAFQPRIYFPEFGNLLAMYCALPIYYE